MQAKDIVENKKPESFEEIEDDVEELKFDLTKSHDNNAKPSVQSEDNNISKQGVIPDQEDIEEDSKDKDYFDDVDKTALQKVKSQPAGSYSIPLRPQAQEKLDCWKNSKRCGKVVEGTNIIPCKTFLLKKRWTSNLNADQQFTPVAFILQMQAEGKKVGAIVDMTSSEHYNWDDLVSNHEQLLGKIEYRKVKIQEGSVPRKKEIEKVFDVLNRHAFQDHSVILHCTYGGDLTGYATSYFLCKKYSMKSEDAIRRFEDAQSSTFANKELMDELKDNFDERVMRGSMNAYA